MWVRTQDKLKLIKVNEVNICYVGGYQIREKTALLGIYSTQEKAFKVLDLMQHSLNGFNGIIKTERILSPNELNKLTKELQTRSFIIDNGASMNYIPVSKVFIMPQDKEV